MLRNYLPASKEVHCCIQRCCQKISRKVFVFGDDFQKIEQTLS